MIGREFDWSIYESKDKLLVGLTALISFLIDFARAVVGMVQIWYRSHWIESWKRIWGGYWSMVGHWLQQYSVSTIEMTGVEGVWPLASEDPSDFVVLDCPKIPGFFLDKLLWSASGWK